MTDKRLSDVVVGDKVCLPTYSGRSPSVMYVMRVGTVEKITATQITALGDRWTKAGKRLGDTSWRPDFLRVWTPELQAEADTGKAVMAAQRACAVAGRFLSAAQGDAAVRLAALLPAELKEGGL